MPLGIFDEFPSLSQVRITRVKLPVLSKSGLFSTDLRKILYLDISENGLEDIEIGALDNLVNLKWLNLASNNLKILHSFVFRDNLKFGIYRSQPQLSKQN